MGTRYRARGTIGLFCAVVIVDFVCDEMGRCVVVIGMVKR